MVLSTVGAAYGTAKAGIGIAGLGTFRSAQHRSSAGKKLMGQTGVDHEGKLVGRWCSDTTDPSKSLIPVVVSSNNYSNVLKLTSRCLVVCASTSSPINLTRTVIAVYGLVVSVLIAGNCTSSLSPLTRRDAKQ